MTDLDRVLRDFTQLFEQMLDAAYLRQTARQLGVLDGLERVFNQR